MIIYTYGYSSRPWTAHYTWKQQKISVTFDCRDMQSRKPEAELEWSDYRTLWVRMGNICRSSPLIVTVLSAFFLPLSVFSYLLYSSGAHRSGLLWLHILYLPGRPAPASLHHSTGLSPELCLHVSTLKEIFSMWPAAGQVSDLVQTRPLAVWRFTTDGEDRARESSGFSVHVLGVMIMWVKISLSHPMTKMEKGGKGKWGLKEMAKEWGCGRRTTGCLNSCADWLDESGVIGVLRTDV